MAEGRTKWGPPDPLGWFVEPIAATEFLLDREDFAGMMIWDPCCGQGNILDAARARGLSTIGIDLVDRQRPTRHPWFQRDFLTQGLPPWPGNFSVIMNPPYGHAKLAEAFIRKAVALPGVQKVAAFVNSKFLFSDTRAAGLHIDVPPARVYPVRPRPSCPPGQLLRDGKIKAQGGVENFVWLVYEGVTAPGETRFIWA